jgi:hypothetical protein
MEIQFRCPNCKRLLVKYDVTHDKMLFKSPGLIEIPDSDNNAIQLICTKCDTLCDITRFGLVFANKTDVPEANEEAVALKLHN